MANATGEMPFLDHLEELRSRLLKSLLAIVLAVGFGIWAVLRWGVIDALKAPIAPFLPDGNLTVLAVTEPFLITLKLGTVVGLVLASPVVLYQVWAFLSPALYEREKKAMIPALFVGLLLFLAGGWVGWAYVVPKALPILLGFQSGSFNIMITYQTYFSFVIQIILALGISAEVPLVMILLAALGIFDARRYNAFRRYAVLLAFIGGALMSPGGDVTLMVLLTLPLLLLYELGVAGAYLVQRTGRRARAIGGMVLLALAAAPGEATAQVRLPTGARQAGQVPARGDTLRRGGEAPRPMDSTTAKRLGLPTGPEREFPPADSILESLLARPGFAVTRFLADSAFLLADSTVIVLQGRAATERAGARLEGGRIVYADARCELLATGAPRMFEEGKVAIGRALRFDTCRERGVITEALTTFDELGANWFVRGNLAVDSSASRLYAAGSEFTSCDLPIAHYHFRAGEVKWVSQSYMVARPAVLYVRDVPIVWLPFLFQDTKPGRRSGILIPQFGFNDIVRPTRSYQRQVTNIGYYWAPNDYLDLTARFDWFASRFVQYGAELQYAWIDRFITGGIGVNRQVEFDGGSSLQFRWNHAQRFNAATTLVMNLDYATDSRVIAGNAVDPLLTTRQIVSSANFTRRYAWGQVALGGTRRQNITDGSGTMSFPSLTVSPKPFDLGRDVTWSPGLTINNETQFSQPQPVLPVVVPGGGGLDSLASTGRIRNSTLSFDTPLRIGGFNWRNRIAVTDRQTVARTVRTERIPDLSTPEPDDSITVTQVRDGDFQSGVNWETAINLPQVGQGTWNITPSVGVRNIASGPFLLRNAATRGEWVQQGKRLELGLAAAPTVYGFLNRGVGPVHRIRHRAQALVNFAWSPEAELSEEYARALSGAGGARAGVPTPARMTLSLGLDQDFTAKLRPPPSDTTSDETQWRKVSLLAITTSPVQYDFEQAKLEGRTGWVTQAVTNSVRSDLVQGLQLSLTHDLWAGQAGVDTARFAPFLSNVQANFTLTGNTFRSIGRLLGLGGGEEPRRTAAAPPPEPPSYIGSSNRRFRPGAFGMNDATAGLRQGGGFRASITYSLSRARGDGPALGPVPTDPDPFNDPLGGIPVNPVTPIGATGQSNVGFNASFSPTPFWSVSWQSQYNITDARFESQQIQLQRDLHDWRASFNFVRSANGNFALFVSIFLINLPDIKFDYNQTTIQP